MHLHLVHSLRKHHVREHDHENHRGHDHEHHRYHDHDFLLPFFVHECLFTLSEHDRDHDYEFLLSLSDFLNSFVHATHHVQLFLFLPFH
jgi:hypothetical protein